ncbi:MAG: hypothetical protein AB1449_15470, partial [Chloroflexota bacterium]
AWAAGQSALNSVGQGLGARVDRVAAGVDRRLMTMANGLDDFVNGRLLRPINAWASGELGREIASQGGIRGVLRNAWDDVAARVQEVGDALRQPNSARFTARLNAASGASALTSLVATIAYGRTGHQVWRDVGGVSDLVGAGLGLVGLRGTIAQVAQTGSGALPELSRFAGLARAAVRVSGVLSAVTGVYTAWTRGGEAVRDFRADGQLSQAGAIAAVEATSGVLAAVGGVLLLTPAAPFAPVLFAASGVLSAGAWLWSNWDRLREGARAYQGIANNAVTITRALAQRATQSVASFASEAAQQVTGFLGRLFGG